MSYFDDKYMEVSFSLLQNIVIHYTQDGDPVYGDSMEIIVERQLFRNIFQITPLEISVGKFDIDRKRLEYLGRAIKQIGAEIEMQAQKGVPAVRESIGRKLYWF